MYNHHGIFRAYFSKVEKENLKSRAECTPYESSAVETLMENVTGMVELNLVRKIHRFSYATDKEICVILSDAGRLTK